MFSSQSIVAILPGTVQLPGLDACFFIGRLRLYFIIKCVFVPKTGVNIYLRLDNFEIRLLRQLVGNFSFNIYMQINKAKS